MWLPLNASKKNLQVPPSAQLYEEHKVVLEVALNSEISLDAFRCL